MVPLLRFELRELLLLREPTLPNLSTGAKIVARELGIEPRTTESKSVVLPLHHSRTENCKYSMSKKDTIQLLYSLLRDANKYDQANLHLAYNNGILISLLADIIDSDNLYRKQTITHLKNLGAAPRDRT